MPAPTIYYLRHGETEWNALGRLQGTRDIPLNARGRDQAVQAGLVLADLLKRDGRDKATLPYVSSPLGRARQTMELARGKLELSVTDYVLDDRLREIGYGVWEGLTLAESEARDPEVYSRRLADKWTVGPAGAETYADVQLRVRAWYDELKADTVAVAHGGTCRALMVSLGLETPASAAELYIEQGAVYVFREGRLEKYS
ncbi:histidine phosphatase family protein [Bradyrhizobium guangzhouense]|uniref:Histidine phosphatase family protein n=1 Tax=Bradyrhizobium guangzhouense TaxID=1325095 RepID=A0AAE6CAC6_9BRAD|nr:histidine phosphatase family protein [Bradyrhizobium guangzhouense]QAU48415.1 histidine phosphatase family protein [Bradyrhizobium guangzhouense]RXH06421.1 histidine phosphatase family protein [Bradyrhizobium guangzhouense]RXH10821.1 histidine phosphatase family protein [Bradyrhizobium guangzhouense]